MPVPLSLSTVHFGIKFTQFEGHCVCIDGSQQRLVSSIEASTDVRYLAWEKGEIDIREARSTCGIYISHYAQLLSATCCSTCSSFFRFFFMDKGLRAIALECKCVSIIKLGLLLPLLQQIPYNVIYFVTAQCCGYYCHSSGTI